MSAAAPSFADVSGARWQRLAGRRIFFGHQSVGQNLVDGVVDVLAADPSVRVRVVASDDARSMGDPALYHARIGRNGQPLSKLSEWERIVSAAKLDGGITLLKFCYVDITSETDVNALLSEYDGTVRRLRAAHPALTVIHVTVPLTMDPGWLRHHAARARGLPSLREANVPRVRYNELLRESYGGMDPVFDLAALESVDAAGRRMAVRHEGRTVPFLHRAWTDDGGHLNRRGRWRIAQAFLATLASIP